MGGSNIQPQHMAEFLNIIYASNSVQWYTVSTREPREMERRISEVARLWERMGQRGTKEAHIRDKIRDEKLTSITLTTQGIRL